MAFPPYLPRFSKEITRLGAIKAKGAIRSRQFRQGFYVTEPVVEEGAKGIKIGTKLVVPHFWATFIHDGRRQVTGDPLLIWFRNPKDDPRLINGNTPERLSLTRKMTHEEFKDWSAQNQARIRQYKRQTGKTKLNDSDYEAMKLPMIVARKSPRGRDSVAGRFFFYNEPGGGMHRFINEAGAEAKRGTSKYVTTRLAKAGFLDRKKSVTIRL